jgi:predicted Zn-dependent peptidase
MGMAVLVGWGLLGMGGSGAIAATLAVPGVDAAPARGMAIAALPPTDLSTPVPPPTAQPDVSSAARPPGADDAALRLWPSATPPTAAGGGSTIRPYLDRVLNRITEFTLDNGMQFIVLERHEAPIISFMTYANVGGANEPDGQTGVAHFLEHLAFKGTSQIGTRNYVAEQDLLRRMDDLKTDLAAARDRQDETAVKALRSQLRDLEQQAQQYVIQNQYGQIVEQAGGVGLNAATSADATFYFYSFPANKLELWMSLESERFLDPVFREFYKEQDVILEERRMRTENSPTGKMLEAFLDTAFTTHPYRRPVIGYDDDIRNLTRPDVREFFDTYYGPNNLTMAIVGDVDPAQVRRLAEIYFGRFQAVPLPEDTLPAEPPQTAPREVALTLDSQPYYFEGYHAPARRDRDALVCEVISSLLSDGRTSRLYQALVEDQQIALSAGGFYGYPGDRYPNLLLFYVETAPDADLDRVGAALQAELARLTREPVSAAELNRVKTQARAARLAQLKSNSSMAFQLAEYEVKTGDWRNLFTDLDRIEAITPADVQRVAQQLLTPENRTIGRLLSDD